MRSTWLTCPLCGTEWLARESKLCSECGKRGEEVDSSGESDDREYE